MIKDDGTINKLDMFQGFKSVKFGAAKKQDTSTWIKAEGRLSDI